MFRFIHYYATFCYMHCVDATEIWLSFKTRTPNKRCEDEIAALVIDNDIKDGFAGDDAHRTSFTSIVGQPKCQMCNNVLLWPGQLVVDWDTSRYYDQSLAMLEHGLRLTVSRLKYTLTFTLTFIFTLTYTFTLVLTL